MPALLMVALAALLTALDTLAPASAAAGQPEPLTLEVRAFNGLEDVTTHTRFTVHRAGERQESIPHAPTGDGRVSLRVPAGIYDVQAIHEREGRVVNIRWANRLVVMPYPDEAGQHLEVVNFKNGFGALQVRGRAGTPVEAAIYQAGRRDKPAAAPIAAANYTLFIVPAGTYDLQVRVRGRATWLTNIDVPLDRTRLSVIE